MSAIEESVESGDIAEFSRLMTFGVEKGYISFSGGDESLSVPGEVIDAGEHWKKVSNNRYSYCACGFATPGSCSWNSNGKCDGWCDGVGGGTMCLGGTYWWPF